MKYIINIRKQNYISLISELGLIVVQPMIPMKYCNIRQLQVQCTLDEKPQISPNRQREYSTYSSVHCIKIMIKYDVIQCAHFYFMLSNNSFSNCVSIIVLSLSLKRYLIKVHNQLACHIIKKLVVYIFLHSIKYIWIPSPSQIKLESKINFQYKESDKRILV